MWEFGLRGDKSTLIAGVTLVGVLVNLSAFGQAANQTNPLASRSVEDIVVTASKRAEKLKDAPAAVTVLDSKAIENLGINQLADYLRYVPSLDDNDAGSPGHGTLILRGINSGYQQTTPTVGFYIDDVPFTPSSSSSTGALVFPDPDLSDVQRIEVLKGPQSTLYGASTLGGLIRIVTKLPDLETYSGDLRVGGVATEHGGYGDGVRASVNIPVVNDKLAVKITGFDRFDPGYVNNVRTDETAVNGTRVDGGRLSVRVDPIENLDIELNAFSQNIHGNAAVEDVNPVTLKPLEGDYNYSRSFNSSVSTQDRIYSLTEKYETDIGALTNSTSYASYSDHEDSDLTAGYGGFAFSGDDPNQSIVGVEIPTLSKLTEDLHFNSVRMGAFEWQVGMFYTHEVVRYTGDLAGVEAPSGVPLAPPLGNVSTSITNAKYEELAEYGDLTYHINDKIDATAGLRYSENTQHSDTVSYGLFEGPSVSNELAGSHETDVSYLFNIRYRPTPDLSTYFRAASAFRPGGPQFSALPGVPSSFGPDTVYSYEVGAKGYWLNHRLSLNADVYYVNWRNIQLDAVLDSFTITGNGGNAHTDGFEIEGHLEPVDYLLFGWNVAYNQSRIDSVNPSNLAGAEVGNRLPFTPKYSGAMTGDYSFPLSQATGGIGASLLYQGKRPTSFAGDDINTSVNLPGYWLLNLRTRIDWKRYSIVFRVDNAMNKYALSNYQIDRGYPGQNIPGAGIPIEPRTFRISLEAHF